MEDHGAGHDRAGKTTAADFVNAGHRYETVAVEAVFDVATRGDLGHSDELYASGGRFAIRCLIGFLDFLHARGLTL